MGLAQCGRREPCQVRNQAALSGEPYVPRGRLSRAWGVRTSHVGAASEAGVYGLLSQLVRFAASGLCPPSEHLPSGTRGRLTFRGAMQGSGFGYASGTVPEVAPAAQLRRRVRAGPGHLHTQVRGRRTGQTSARVPVLRHARNRQNILREDPGKSGQLRAPDSRRSLWRVRRLPLHEQPRRRHRRTGDGRRLQQRRG